MQALGQLSSAIAHDFNNILTAIIGCSDLVLKKYNKNSSTYSNINHIKQNATRASNLVRQLLTFSKKTKIEPTSVDVGQTILDLSSLLQQLMGPATSVSIEKANKKMLALVDITQLEQVIINLAINARDAMCQDGLVRINIEPVLVYENFNQRQYFTPDKNKNIEAGEYIKISISDTGTGIEEEILQKIFEPFFSTKEQAGTGLGLATVAQIISKMNGRIFVETMKNKGTTFYIFLKQIHESNMDIVAEEEIKQEDDIGRHHKILVVEDEQSIRSFNVLALKKYGYIVDEAQSSEEAINLITEQNKNYDLILSDIFIGNANGAELSKKIKTYLPKVKVLLTSGYDISALRDTNVSEFTFLAKPYNLEDLISNIKNMLK